MALDIKSLEEQNMAELSQFADIGRLSAGLFHDLATPLNIVLLNLEELQNKCSDVDDEHFAELRSAINRAVNGTQRMVRFLELAREHVHRKTVLSEFSITQEITEVVSLFTKTMNSNEIKIDFNKNDNITYFGNSTQFFQVMMNLIANAIESYPTQTQEKKVSVELHQTVSEILITVQDWGAGISEDDLPQIFEPLFTTKSASNGTGIGLFITREIIEKHFRGSIQVVSDKQTGSTFTIHLPRRASLRALE